MIGIFLTLALHSYSLNTETYVVKHVSARYLADIVAPSSTVTLMPQGVKFVVDNDRNCFVLDGDLEGVAEAKQMLQALDVAPVQFRLRVFVSLAGLQREWASDSTISNNTVWSLVDAPSALAISIKPRMKTSGQIEFDVDVKSNGTSIKTQGVAKPGQVVSFVKGGGWSSTELTRARTAMRTSQDDFDVFTTVMSSGLGLNIAVCAETVPKQEKKD